jgi:ABC-type uncharacterized transport system permease subunit
VNRPTRRLVRTGAAAAAALAVSTLALAAAGADPLAALRALVSGAFGDHLT